MVFLPSLTVHLFVLLGCIVPSLCKKSFLKRGYLCFPAALPCEHLGVRYDLPRFAIPADSFTHKLSCQRDPSVVVNTCALIVEAIMCDRLLASALRIIYALLPNFNVKPISVHRLTGRRPPKTCIPCTMRRKTLPRLHDAAAATQIV
ncbi:hypothetical protein BDR07DRAFT_195182 [Suillus spraguei]|nr:hypothetical protein BDR07DRAFT_195182 [Suillus spraguei]